MYNGNVQWDYKSYMKKLKFKIEGMHCSSCAMNIDFDVEDLEGVNYCKTSYAKQESEVDFDENKISADQITGQIKETGYIAQPLKT